MTENEQIVRDIDAWAQKRLQQWLVDAMMRYETADVAHNEAWASITTITVAMAAMLASRFTKISPEEIGEVFAEMVAVRRGHKFVKDNAK